MMCGRVTYSLQYIYASFSALWESLAFAAFFESELLPLA